MAFGETIRRLRLARNWTLQELGQATDPKMSVGAVGSVESGRNDNPTDKMVRRFAKAFGMPVTQLRHESGLDGGDSSPSIEDLRAEGVPEDVLAKLQEVYPDLDGEYLVWAIQEAREAKRRNLRPTPQRPQHTISTGQEISGADSPLPPADGRDSA